MEMTNDTHIKPPVPQPLWAMHSAHKVCLAARLFYNTHCIHTFWYNIHIYNAFNFVCSCYRRGFFSWCIYAMGECSSFHSFIICCIAPKNHRAFYTLQIQQKQQQQHGQRQLEWKRERAATKTSIIMHMKLSYVTSFNQFLLFLPKRVGLN